MGHSPVDVVAIPVFRGVLELINLAKDFSPIDSLSTGRSVTWGELARAFGQIVVLLGGSIGLVGIIVFTRRELATAQSPMSGKLRTLLLLLLIGALLVGAGVGATVAQPRPGPARPDARAAAGERAARARVHHRRAGRVSRADFQRACGCAPPTCRTRTSSLRWPNWRIGSRSSSRISSRCGSCRPGTWPTTSPSSSRKPVLAITRTAGAGSRPASNCCATTACATTRTRRSSTASWRGSSNTRSARTSMTRACTTSSSGPMRWRRSSPRRSRTWRS